MTYAERDHFEDDEGYCDHCGGSGVLPTAAMTFAKAKGSACTAMASAFAQRAEARDERSRDETWNHPKRRRAELWKLKWSA